MIRILPGKTETIISALKPAEVTGAMNKVVEPLAGRKSYYRFKDHFLFTGQVWSNGFNIISCKEGNDFFVPRITGNVENAGLGSIIYLHFRLTPLARASLIFFTILSFFIFIFFLAYNRMIFIGEISVVVGVLNFILALKNFSKSVRKTKGEILWILNLRMKLIS